MPDLELSKLPTELQLRVLDFLSTPSLLQVSQTSKYWNHLIDAPEQDHLIYRPRTVHPPDAETLSFVNRDATCFTRYYNNHKNVSSWRDLCRCQHLLSRSWARDNPATRTSLIAPRRSNVNAPFGYTRRLVDLDIAGTASTFDPAVIPVWRFRPDFHRRFVLATTQHGGLLVTDMDTGSLLWSLRRDQVRSYAHLEYSNGWAAFDRYGNNIEIWRHIDGDDTRRGSFEKVCDLAHDVDTRGFQMLWPTLCVVSTEKQGFVYDLSADGGPTLKKKMSIACGAIGHIEQNAEDIVMYCMGTKGYYFHSKSTGRLEGTLNPSRFTARGTFHVSHRHGDTLTRSILSQREPLPAPFPPRKPVASHKPRSLPVGHGVNIARESSLAGLNEDEWGAGLIRGDMMVGISKGGRCMLCLDWPGAIRSNARASQVTFLLELEIDASTYQFGGWLGVQRGPPGPTRIIFEVDDKVYIVRLAADTEPLLDGSKSLPEMMDVLSVPASCGPNLGVPISFMGVYDDCIMHTSVVGINRREGSNRDPYIAKAIRIISFAPIEVPVRGTLDQPLDEPEDEWEELELRQMGPWGVMLPWQGFL